jgi:hypothetical protein
LSGALARGACVDVCAWAGRAEYAAFRSDTVRAEGVAIGSK